MSIRLSTLCDEINWLKVRKEYGLRKGSIDLFRYLCWRQGEKPPYAVYIPEDILFELTARPSSTYYDDLRPLKTKKFIIQTVRGSNVNKTTANLRINENIFAELPKLSHLRNTGDVISVDSVIGEFDRRDTVARTPVKRSSDSGIGDPKLNKLNKTKLNEIDKSRIDISKVKRFEKLTVQLLPDRRELLAYGKNLDPYLDAIEKFDPDFTHTAKRLNKYNIATPIDVSGALVKELAVISGVKFESKNTSEIPWCGNEFCDKKTRQFLEPSEGVDGKLTNDCPTCNPRQLELKRRLSEREHTDTTFKAFSEGFKPPI